MNADKLSAESAFDTGAELWVLPFIQNNWWQQIDYRSGFLLSECLLHQKKEILPSLLNILKETQISEVNHSTHKKSLLVGTEHHFFNKWILIVPIENDLAHSEIIEICNSLKIHSVRFFSTPDALIQKVLTRPSASLNRISFVE